VRSVCCLPVLALRHATREGGGGLRGGISGDQTKGLALIGWAKESVRAGRW
jgi:hypothetical protein